MAWCPSYQPLDRGDGKAHIVRYGFNTGRCTDFVWGGGRSNSNNYATIDQFQAACEPKSKSQSKYRG